jgi:hypothetical protein
MSQFTKTNGDLLPVINYDSPAYTNSGANAVTSAATVQPQGPKLDFFRFVAANTMNSQGEVNGFVANVLQALQQTTTVAMYQVDGTALSVAIYPTGAFANTTVATATANAAGVVGVNQINSSTNVGFKLST